MIFKGCRYVVGIDLKNKVIKPLLEAAKDKLWILFCKIQNTFKVV